MAAYIDWFAFERAPAGQAGQQNANDETVNFTDHLLDSCGARLTKSASNLSMLLVTREIVSKILAGVDRFYHSPNTVVHQ